MALKDAAQATSAWKTGFGSAAPTVEKGLRASNKQAGQRAADASDAYVAGVTANVGKFKARVAGVTNSQIADAVRNKAGNFAAGANKGAPRYSNYYQSAFLPAVTSLQSQLDGIRKDRSTTMQRFQLSLDAMDSASKNWSGQP